MVTKKAMRMAMGSPEKSLVSQLSGEDQPMLSVLCYRGRLEGHDCMTAAFGGQKACD